MASQSKHRAEAQSKRQPLPDFELDDEDDKFGASLDHLHDAVEMVASECMSLGSNAEPEHRQ